MTTSVDWVIVQYPYIIPDFRWMSMEKIMNETGEFCKSLKSQGIGLTDNN